jgi:hypothetical protein
MNHDNPKGNYALHSVRLKADIESLGWAMRDKKWERAEELLERAVDDLSALISYVSERRPKP